MKLSYTVEYWDCGIVLKGPSIPLESLLAVAKQAETLGFNINDMGVASALRRWEGEQSETRAVMVMTNAEGSQAFRQWIDRRNAALPSKELRWLRGYDTGASSVTIYWVMIGRIINEEPPSTPSDADDFGRCYRLLKLFPEWRARLGEVGARYSAWAPLVIIWDELTSLYENDQFEGLRHRIRTASAVEEK